MDVPPPLPKATSSWTTGTRYIAISVFAALAPLLNYGMAYLQGRSCAHFTLLLLPPTFFILFAALLCFFAMLFSMGRDFLNRKLPIKKTLLFGASVCMFAFLFHTLPSFVDSFLLGFRETIKARVSDDQFYSIASVARNHISDGDTIWWKDIIIHASDASNVSQRNSLPAAVDLTSLPRNYVIANRAGKIEIKWGSALTGSWGVRISDETSAPQERDYGFLPINNRITTFYTD